MDRVFPIVVQHDPEPRFRVAATAPDGSEHVAEVRAPAARCFRPSDVAAALAKAGSKGRRKFARRGIKEPTIKEVICID